MILRCIALFRSRLIAIPPRFWVMAAGLAMLFHGAEKLMPGCGWVAMGAVIVVDVMRDK